MIKAIKITPLNTSQTLAYKCGHCGEEGIFILENSIIETDNNGENMQIPDCDCPECNKKL